MSLPLDDMCLEYKNLMKNVDIEYKLQFKICKRGYSIWKNFYLIRG